MNKYKALQQFITEFKGKTFSEENPASQWLEERLPALVEEIYKEEQAIADKRWQEAERPMFGVSQWKEYGKKMGYWDYFKDEIIKEYESKRIYRKKD